MNANMEYIKSQQSFINMMKKSKIKGIICLCGNDGTGKSTLQRLINHKSDYQCIQRSSASLEPEFIPLKKQIQQIDKLTFAYSFETDRYQFTPSQSLNIDGIQYDVHWIMLQTDSSVLKERIRKRLDISEYEHEKTVDYFNEVYHQMAYFYGMNLINVNKSLEQIVNQIFQCVSSKISPLKIKNLSLNNVFQNDIERYLCDIITQKEAETIFYEFIVPQLEKSQMKDFYFPEMETFVEKENLKQILSAKWAKNNLKINFEGEKKIKLEGNGFEFVVDLKHNYYFEKIIQGESKMIYKIRSNCLHLSKLYEDKIVIILKGTIYSHKKQNTGQITQLGKVRAKGSMLFLEMLRRNKLKHSYICVNPDGIILSKFVKTNELQIIFKKQFLGTDKHSYHHLKDCPQILKETGEYFGGIYIRFDWRNPNHVLNSAPQKLINLDPYYYEVEKFVGKSNFFDLYFSSQARKCTPIGDKCITEDLISNYTNTHSIKSMIIQAYSTFQYYANQNGLEILDGCFMIDEACSTIWSEINPDCLRVKSIENREDYDKDIWRVGGTSSKELIMKKWTLFNEIFINYFKNHRFMETELKTQKYCKEIQAEKIIRQPIRPGYSQYYNEIIRGKRKRQIIGTIDIINGEPILVECSIFKEKHSDGNLSAAWEYLNLLPQIVIVDIDGASGKQQNNTEKIISLCRKQPNNLFAVGGGIRTVEKAKRMINSAGKIIISSNLDLLHELSEEQKRKVIVELSVNEKNEVLTHARTVNTKTDLLEKIKDLCLLGIRTISITFRNSQGKLQGLPREQLRKIMMKMPGPIEKIIIAGGISSIDDIQHIWGYPRCVPQLGSAIWKKKVSIGQIYKKMVRYDANNLVSAVIKTVNNKVQGLVYLNDEAIERTCEQRYLYRYSRQHKKLMKKGQTSGNLQRVISMNVDCDNDSLLISVEEVNDFCHLQKKSCFYENQIENHHKTLQGLQSHIKKSKNQEIGSGYSHKLQNNPSFAYYKMIEELDELGRSENKERKIEQSADLLAHLLMYLNGSEIDISDVLGVLNMRSKQKRQKKKQQKVEQILIGVALGKHTKHILNLMKSSLGVVLFQREQRDYSLSFEVVDEEKYEKYFGKNLVKFISVKPKDMLKLMVKNTIHYGINYTNHLSFFDNNYTKILSEKTGNLKLALVKRKGEKIDPKSWTKQKKGQISSQYPHQVFKFMIKNGISSDCYSLTRISGQSESYLNIEKFDYTDAIINTGETLKSNNLEVEAIICQEIEVVLFKLD